MVFIVIIFKIIILVLLLKSFEWTGDHIIIAMRVILGLSMLLLLILDWSKFRGRRLVSSVESPWHRERIIFLWRLIRKVHMLVLNSLLRINLGRQRHLLYQLALAWIARHICNCGVSPGTPRLLLPHLLLVPLALDLLIVGDPVTKYAASYSVLKLLLLSS